MESSSDPDPSRWSRLNRFVKEQLSIREKVKHVGAIVKKHGWKLGVAAVLFELTEHFVLPAVLVAVTGQPALAITGTIPWGEAIFYPVLFRIMGGNA